MKKNELRSVQALVIVGDSELENNLEVAAGFQKDILADDEVIIPEHFAKYLGFVETPAEAFVQGFKQKVDLTFDLSTSIPSDVFDAHYNGSRGKHFLRKMGMPESMTVSQLT